MFLSWENRLGVTIITKTSKKLKYSFVVSKSFFNFAAAYWKIATNK
jgi:hypothetical protein